MIDFTIFLKLYSSIILVLLETCHIKKQLDLPSDDWFTILLFCHLRRVLTISWTIHTKGRLTAHFFVKHAFPEHAFSAPLKYALKKFFHCSRKDAFFHSHRTCFWGHPGWFEIFSSLMIMFVEDQRFYIFQREG